MYRFALRGRWLAGGLAVVAAAGVCVRLGIWQLHRLDERRDYTSLVDERGELPPASLDDVLPSGAGDVGDSEYRQVTVEGRYEIDHEILVLARSHQGVPGQHVLTPLRLSDGSAVLVNRGFVPVTDPEAVVPPEARASGGAVVVEGVLRASENGGRFFAATEAARTAGTLGHVNRIDVGRIDEEVPGSLRPAYVRVEAPIRESTGQVPTPLLPPEPGDGPHLGYAAQWFAFAVVFLAGWAVLIRRSARHSHNGN